MSTLPPICSHYLHLCLFELWAASTVTLILRISLSHGEVAFVCWESTTSLSPSSACGLPWYIWLPPLWLALPLQSTLHKIWFALRWLSAHTFKMFILLSHLALAIYIYIYICNFCCIFGIGQTAVISSLLLSCGSQVSNSVHQAWQQMTFLLSQITGQKLPCVYYCHTRVHDCFQSTLKNSAKVTANIIECLSLVRGYSWTTPLIVTRIPRR